MNDSAKQIDWKSAVAGMGLAFWIAATFHDRLVSRTFAMLSIACFLAAIGLRVISSKRQLAGQTTTAPNSRWFRIAYRITAGIFLAGLIGCTACNAIVGSDFPKTLGGILEFMLVYGAVAFIVVQWAGVHSGCTSIVDAAMYSILFLAFGCGGLAAVR